MNIGILYICTGKYDKFFKGFYESCERNFLTDSKKIYYVWTDSYSEIFEKPNVVKFEQPKLGWPYDTMMRYSMFNKRESRLVENDYLFFFNANMIVDKIIGEEIIPQEENSFLVGVEHPGFYKSHPNRFPYERNPNSSLYVPYGNGKNYFQGCFNGGRTDIFLQMSKTLEEKINEDMSSDIIPIWHDESAINWYYKDKDILVLDSGYAYPETLKIPFDKKIIQLDKNKLGGHKLLRS